MSYRQFNLLGGWIGAGLIPLAIFLYATERHGRLIIVLIMLALLVAIWAGYSYMRGKYLRLLLLATKEEAEAVLQNIAKQDPIMADEFRAKLRRKMMDQE